MFLRYITAIYFSTTGIPTKVEAHVIIIFGECTYPHLFTHCFLYDYYTSAIFSFSIFPSTSTVNFILCFACWVLRPWRQFSTSSIVCGRGRPTVSGSSRVNPAAMTAITPNTAPGNHGATRICKMSYKTWMYIFSTWMKQISTGRESASNVSKIKTKLT